MYFRAKKTQQTQKAKKFQADLPSRNNWTKSYFRNDLYTEAQTLFTHAVNNVCISMLLEPTGKRTDSTQLADNVTQKTYLPTHLISLSLK